MKLLIDYLSIVIFYIGYVFYVRIPEGIISALNAWFSLGLIPGDKSSALYFAIFIGIIAAGLQVLIHWMIDRKPSKLHVITFLAFLVFGSMTFFFRDPMFIKWKPTIVNVIFALVFLGSTIIGEKSLVERMMGKTIQASKQVWHRLTLGWTAFFIFIAILNIIVAYKFSETTWVNFKLFGILGLTFCFLVLQALYVSKQSLIDKS